MFDRLGRELTMRVLHTVGSVQLMIAAGVLLAATQVASAAEVSLFDGKTLAGWTLKNDAKARVVDGVLELTDGNGWLRSHQQYTDFRLHIEWKAVKEKDYDSGVYIRTPADGAPFPKGAYQINLLDGKEGNLTTIPAASSTGLIKRGEWNTFDVEVIGDTASLKINGKAAWKVGGLKNKTGYVGLQCEVPKGGAFRFRNIRIEELGAVALFDGQSLQGWVGADAPAEQCWKVADGLLECTGEKGPWIRSAKEYADFNLRFDYQVSKGGNSGVYVRVPKDGNHHRENATLPEAGFEVQVLDDAAPEHSQLKDYQYSASVYDIAGASPRVCLPPGEWNTLEIECRGQTVRTIHNGEMVTNVAPESHPQIALRKTSGYLGLQNHSTVVRFRNIRLTELN
jgi:hypothetical protein